MEVYFRDAFYPYENLTVKQPVTIQSTSNGNQCFEVLLTTAMVRDLNPPRKVFMDLQARTRLVFDLVPP